MRLARLILLGLLLSLPGAAAQAQVLGPLPGAGRILPGLGEGLGDPLGQTDRVARTGAGRALRAAPELPQTLSRLDAPAESLERRAGRLLREHRRLVEPDAGGRPVVRGEVLAIGLEPSDLAAIRRLGFRVRAPEPSALGLQMRVLRAPRGLPVEVALDQLRALKPEAAFDYNHIYFEHGAAEAGGAAAEPAARRASSRPGPVGLVDGGVAADHPAFRGVRITQKGFAPGGLRASPHATAVASLISGEARGFRGAAPGAPLLVADVYGATAAGGSAAAIVQGLSWLAGQGAPVINVSLAGPDNLAVKAAVAALVSRGVRLVAAVGNDGPAAPPRYPAAYPGVIAVTAVDGRKRALPEAGRGSHVDFAAPGAEIAAAGPGGRWVAVRGTSFAAPLVAGALAAASPEALAARAEDLGAPGRDPVYGLGLLEFHTRNDPARLGSSRR